MADILKGSLIIGQSGGPSPVINSSCYGVIRTALDTDCITKVYGASHGIAGVLKDQLFVLDEESKLELDLLPYTPSSALGSCRYKMADPDKDDTDYVKILEIFKKYNVRYFCYNGGNDSMDTCNKIARYMRKVGYDCRIMGIPKTIDNDLFGTDHCPGYPSSAKYIATSIAEISRDARVYDVGQVTIVECMGRHAGWLTAAAALSNHFEKCCDLIYLPETDFDMDKFLSDVKAVYDKQSSCIVAVSEGIHYADGTFVSEAKTSSTDGFGHAQLGGLAATLANIVKEKLGCKVRGIELSLLQRCCAHSASQTDIDEAFGCGKFAVEQMVCGTTNKMAGIVCTRGKDLIADYKARYELFDLCDCANFEKKFPKEWITPEQNGVTEDFIAYALPLIQGESKIQMVDGLPRFTKLKKIMAK